MFKKYNIIYSENYNLLKNSLCSFPLELKAKKNSLLQIIMIFI